MVTVRIGAPLHVKKRGGTEGKGGGTLGGGKTLIDTEGGENSRGKIANQGGVKIRKGLRGNWKGENRDKEGK